MSLLRNEHVDVRDDRFFEVVAADAVVRRLATGMVFTEGPVWLDDALIFSDIPANKLMSWSPERGLTVFRDPGNWPNGNALDHQGRLITCEHGWRDVTDAQLTRRLTRTETLGSITVLVDRVQGRRLNSPNDVAVDAQGCVWFTDPPWGKAGFTGSVRRGQGTHPLYRWVPDSGELAVAWDGLESPNGLCFGVQERSLYVGNSIPDDPVVYRFEVQKGYVVVPPVPFARIERGVPDGMCVDDAGRLYCSGGDAIYVFAPDGCLLGKLFIPEMATNCCFGQADGRTLFITAESSLYAVSLHVKGER